MISFLILTALLQVDVKIDEVGVKSQKVELFRFATENSDRSKMEAITNKRGRATFKVDSKEDFEFVLRTVYDGVDYFSPGYRSIRLPNKPILLRVYKSVPSHEKVHISDLRIYLDFDGENLVAHEEVIVQNNSKYTIVGKKDDSRPPETFRFSGPASAFKLQLGEGFQKEETHFEGNAIVLSSPLLPGNNHFSWNYSIEKPGVSYLFAQNLSLPVKHMSLATAYKNLKFKGLPFEQKGDKYFAGAIASTYELKLGAANDIEFKISGLPFLIRFSKILPVAILLLLFGMVIVLSRWKQKASELSDPAKLLKELLFLRRMRNQSVINEAEYQSHRLQILEQLVPFYDHKEDST